MAYPAFGQSASPPVSDLQTLSKDPNQWVMPAKNYASTRYSELDQINASNVGQLQLAWTFSNGIAHGQEAVPLVVNGTMYIVSPYPNTLYALDATTGDLKWSYSVPPDPAAKGVACCDLVNRGAAYDNGKIFFNSLDDFTVAVDANSGKVLWHTKLGDITDGETMTMAPLVVHGKVIVGNSGGELGIRGWVTALDENSGKIIWRAYGAGPDKDVLIGPDFKPFYSWMKGTDLGVKSWPADDWKTSGAGMWGWLSYDPDLNLLYYGTSNPGPWNSAQRPGDNLWASTIFARDPDTGAAKWAYQTSPHDLWDHDSINEIILLDLTIDGKQRKVAIRPGRTGYMYVIDRQTGQVLSADPFDTITAYKGVDLKTGRIIPNPDLDPKVNTLVQNVCPAAPGAKDWQPSAWSPRTKLLYVPHQHLCMDFKGSEVGYIAGTPFLGATVDMYAGPGDGYRGEFMAWDPVSGKKIWAIHERFPVWSGTVVTAGDVAFYGTMDRWFKAVNAKTGELLWKFRAPSGFIGQPVTYKGSDGRQYVAILSGVGGWPGVIANAELDPRVRNGALGFVGAMQDLPAYTRGGDVLMVFALPKANSSSPGQSAPLQGTPSEQASASSASNASQASPSASASQPTSSSSAPSTPSSGAPEPMASVSSNSTPAVPSTLNGSSSDPTSSQAGSSVSAP
ncbi:MAG: PQQ-dependent dehydrogenase, methanol/ethanol family [Devosia sp.]